ncbi:c-type cytochrome [Kaarinaea lacus]
MRKGEKGILGVIVAFVVIGAGYKFLATPDQDQQDQGLPFYTTADKETEKAAGKLMRELNCRDCHKYGGAFGGITSLSQNVPAPPLDGIGSLRDEAWFYNYFSAENPQSILPSRLKKEFQMPSYASLKEVERRLLASYLASLKVKDWYLEETKKTEYEKLTGKSYTP